MYRIAKEVNRAVLRILNRMDANPAAGRPVLFWFYSDSESGIYRLADHLQFNGYAIVACEPSLIPGEYRCMAEKAMVPGDTDMARLWMDMQIVAERFGAKFDGWETQVC